MDFRQLDYFRAVVAAGSVSQAAKNLNMTQPPVSHAIAKLERELGVRLLERTAKGVHPTQAGLHLLSRGERLLADRNRLVETLKLMGEGAAGDLRIGVEPMGINEIIADVLAEFLEQVPSARVSLADVTPDVIVQKIGKGELDMGCVPFAPAQFSGFVADICDWSPIIDINIKLAVPKYRAKEKHPDGKGWGRWILPSPMPAFSACPSRAESSVCRRFLRSHRGLHATDRAPFRRGGTGGRPRNRAHGRQERRGGPSRPPAMAQPHAGNAPVETRGRGHAVDGAVAAGDAHCRRAPPHARTVSGAIHETFHPPVDSGMEREGDVKQKLCELHGIPRDVRHSPWCVH